MAANGDVTREPDKWRRLLDLLPILILEVDQSGRLTYANRAAEQITGRSREELLSMEVLDLLPQEDRSEGANTLGQGLSGPDIGAHTRRILLPDGTTREGIARAVTVEDNRGRRSLLACFTDLTERRQLLDELHVSRTFYEGLAESDVGLLCRFSSQARAVFANEALCQAMGRAREELMGRSPFQFTHPQDIALARETWDRAVRTRSAVHGEFRITGPDGWLWVEWILIPVFDVQGDLLEMQSVGHDVTQRRLVRAQLAQAQRALLDAREEERRILAAELHDSVGQGLVAAQLALQKVQRHVEETGQDDLQKAAATLGHLVREIRQISYGLYPPGLESLGLWPSLEQLSRFAQAAGMRTQLRVEEDLTQRRLGSTTQIALFRIAQEAVHNVTRHSRASLMTLELGWQGAQVRLRIADNGVGFDTSDPRTVGLGLNTMRDRASAAGGRLEIHSRSGLTEVIAELPDLPDGRQAEEPIRG
jgi:PAS domain S-box-containing protein